MEKRHVLDTEITIHLLNSDRRPKAVDFAPGLPGRPQVPHGSHRSGEASAVCPFHTEKRIMCVPSLFWPTPSFRSLDGDDNPTNQNFDKKSNNGLSRTVEALMPERRCCWARSRCMLGYKKTFPSRARQGLIPVPQRSYALLPHTSNLTSVLDTTIYRNFTASDKWDTGTIQHPSTSDYVPLPARLFSTSSQLSFPLRCICLFLRQDRRHP